MPEGLIPLGDTVCSFNRVYGQGMTVAALQRWRCAQLGSPPLQARQVIAAIARVIDASWEMATGADLAFLQAEGRRTRRQRLPHPAARVRSPRRDARLGVHARGRPCGPPREQTSGPRRDPGRVVEVVQWE
jgi:hypothetical protein